MTQTEMIALAEAYVALSNAHRVNFIESFFSETSRYCSSAVGEYQGKSEINNMMRNFFAQYPDSHWNVDRYQCAGMTVSFLFELTATEAASGQSLKRKGKETITFDNDGRIQLLTVEAAPSD